MEAIGILYLFILFIACFIAVHAVKLALLGLKSLRRTEEKKPGPQEKPERPEPVYYIVEKKQKRRRQEYRAPREIKFK